MLAFLLLPAPLLFAAPTVNPTLTILDVKLPANASGAIGVSINGGNFVANGTMTLREGPVTVGASTSIIANIAMIPVTLSAGPHTLIASYSGDANYFAAQSPPAVITAVATTVVLSATGPAPGLVFGVRATVTGEAFCAGTVSLTDSGKVLDTLNLQFGVTSIEFSTYLNPKIPDGTHTFVALFTKTGVTCTNANSAPLTVYTGYPTSVTAIVSITPNPSLFGQLPQAVVKVTAASGAATGRVTIKQGSTTLALSDLDSSATARVSLPSLPVGSWPVRAEYAGSPLVQASTSAPFTLVVNPAIVTVSSASGKPNIAPDSLATVYGMNIAAGIAQAPGLPLPVDLGGVSVSVSAADGGTQKAPLLFVSPGQVNFLVPSNAKLGAGVLIVSNGGGAVFGDMQIDAVAPAIFTADGTGAGAPIAILVTAHADGSQQSKAAYECGAAGCRTLEMDVSGGGDTNILVLYATGVRHAKVEEVSVKVDSVNVPVLYAGAQNEFPGLDQVNLQLPASLAGRGEVVLEISAAGKAGNPVKVRFR